MSSREDVAYRAGRLIQWGLQPRLRPAQDPEYGELVEHYQGRSDFRRLVEEFAEGLGLFVLDVSDHGIVLSPVEDSVFRMKASDWRAGSTRADDRLLDGLVQVAIATTIFPRPGDLEDDVERPRPPVTVAEIEDHLRLLCERLAEDAREHPDPDAQDDKEGLSAAWRVYHERYATRETVGGRPGRRSTTGIIEFALERLREQGCFVPTQAAGNDAWQPTRRYNVLVQELAATQLYEDVLRAWSAGDPAPDAEASDWPDREPDPA